MTFPTFLSHAGRDALRRPWMIPVHLIGWAGLGCTLAGALLGEIGKGVSGWVDQMLGEEW